MSPLSETLERALVYHKLRIIYVPVQKAACSSIKSYLHGLEGIPFKDKKQVHLKGLPGLDTLSNMSASRFAETVLSPAQRYKMFSVVRHPFGRFVSAYRDKVAKLTGTDVDFAAPRPVDRRDIDLLLFIGSLRGINPVEVTDITVEEFCQYTETSRMAMADVHWRVQSTILSVKALPYAHILRLEDIAEAPALLSDTLGLETPFDITANKSRGKMIMLDDAMRDRLAQIYKLDFKQFGYTPEEYNG